LRGAFAGLNNIDVRVKRLLGIVTMLFVSAVALQINGASIGVWKDALQDDRCNACDKIEGVHAIHYKLPDFS
jgi:hypothetical protein